MSQLAIVGLTARDRVDGEAATTGGAPYYGVLALRELGASAVVVTRVAASDAALLEPFADAGTEPVSRPASATAAYTLTHDAGGGERRIALESVGEPWDTAALEAWVLPTIAGCSIVHAGALCSADFPPGSLSLLAEGRRLSFDAQGLVRPSRLGPVTYERPASLDALEHVDVVKLSLEEAAVLDIEPTEPSMRALGVDEVVLTGGAEGGWIWAEGALTKIRTEPVAVHDTTGAGDGFIACYLHARLEGATYSDAGRVAASAVAAMLRHRTHETQ